MKIVFVTAAGASVEVQALAGQTLMEVATQNGVPGIAGDCGGGCSCGTCHVRLPADLAARLQRSHPRSPMELALLEDSDGYSERTSRLGCQVQLAEDMGDLRIEVADR